MTDPVPCRRPSCPGEVFGNLKSYQRGGWCHNICRSLDAMVELRQERASAGGEVDTLVLTALYQVEAAFNNYVYAVRYKQLPPD
jgi:hypothetical protein